MGLEEEFLIFSKQSRCEELHPQPSGTYGTPQGAVQLSYSWLEVFSGEFTLQ